MLKFFTSVMRGDEKDAFGLDASLQDRLKAAESLGKRYRLFDKPQTSANTDDNIERVTIVNDLPGQSGEA